MSVEYRQGSIRQVSLIVDWDVLELGMLTPVLVKDQEELLGFTQGKDWHQALSAPQDYVCDGFCEVLFSLCFLGLISRTVGAFDYEHINFAVSELSRLQDSVFLSTVVSRVQNLDAIDLNQEHSGAEHVSCPESRELDPVHLDLLMIVNQLDLV